MGVAKIIDGFFKLVSLFSECALQLRNLLLQLNLVHVLALFNIVDTLLDFVFLLPNVSEKTIDFALKVIFILIADIKSFQRLHELLFFSFEVFEQVIHLILKFTLFSIVLLFQLLSDFLGLIQALVIQLGQLGLLVLLAFYFP